jgi:DNA-binding transcriptional ArsR family regulator
MEIDGKSNYKASVLNVVDASGEVEQWMLSRIRRKFIKGGFFMAIQDGFVWLASLKLEGRTKDVLFYVMGRLEFENYINLSQKDIAEALGMQKQNVSSAMKELEEHGIIHKGSKVGQSWTYRLDPNLGYKGRAKNLKKYQETIDRARSRVKGFDIIEGKKDKKPTGKKNREN